MSTCYSHCIFGQCNLKIKIPIKYSLNNSLICFYIIWAFFFPTPNWAWLLLSTNCNPQLFSLQIPVDVQIIILILGLQTKVPKLSKRGIHHQRRSSARIYEIPSTYISNLVLHQQFVSSSVKSSSTASNVYIVALFLI